MITASQKKPNLSFEQKNHKGLKIPVARLAFYLGYYLFALVSGCDFYIFLITLPMFLIILFSLIFTDARKLGYIDAIAVVYFLSFVITPLQNAFEFSFPYSDISRGWPYSETHFIIVSALAIFSYTLLFIFLKGEDLTHGRSTRSSTNHLLIIGAATFFVLLAIAGAGSLGNLLASRFEKEAGDAGFFVPISIAALSINAVFSIINTHPQKNLKIASICFAILGLSVVANPFNTPRFFLLGAWIPVIATAFPLILRPRFFYSFIPVVVLIILPALSISTRFSEDRSGMLRSIFNGEDSIFRISYFGLFEAGLETIRYVEMRGHEYGGIFISTVLTFFPRAWWPDKPINSGLLIGYMNTDEGLHNSNLAIPWFMDGYMDFGIIGSLAYSIIFALFLYKCKTIFSGNKFIENIYFYIFLANIAILLRGTLAVTYILFLFQIIFFTVYCRISVKSEVGRLGRSRRNL